MTALPDPWEPLVFNRVPAEEVNTFIASQRERAQARAEAADTLADIEARAERVAAQTEQTLAALDARIESEAEQIATRSAEKLKVKQDAIAAAAAIVQCAVIADDYAKLETWITTTISGAVENIIKGMSAQDQWEGLIRKALDQTKERWNLNVICHPDDYDSIVAVIHSTDLGEAIGQVSRDDTLLPGDCFLKGNEDYFELNIRCQITALKHELTRYFDAPAETND